MNLAAFINYLNIDKRKLWIQCWANVMRKGERISPHIHSVKNDSYLGGHIMVQCDNTDTVYINPVNQLNEPDVYKSENVVGKLTLFQSYIPHYTTEHKGDQERISIAFDIFLDNVKNLDNKILLENA